MVEQQGLYIAALALVGALMGTVFDVYNTVTGAAKWFRWLRPVLDVFFWMLSAVAVYYVTLRMDSGRLRIYSFLLLVMGYVLYRLFFHRTVVASAFRIVRFTQSLLRAVTRLLDVLIWRPIRFVLYVLGRLGKALYTIGCKLEAALFVILRFVAVRIIWSWITRIPGAERSFYYLDKLWKDFWNNASKWLRARITGS